METIYALWHWEPSADSSDYVCGPNGILVGFFKTKEAAIEARDEHIEGDDATGTETEVLDRYEIDEQPVYA